VRALRLHGSRDLRLDDVAAPPAPGRGEVLVAPVVGGICGTDLQLYRGTRPLERVQILCHEFAGEVAAVGAGVESVAPGDRVAVMPIVACGRCETCRRGRGELCPGHETVGLRHAWGGFGELALVGEVQVARLPDGVTWDEGALVEPISVAATGVERAGVGAGDRVLVVGGGPIGALAALLARAAGADVVVCEPAAGRAERLRGLGFEVVDPRRERPGDGFHAAIDCAGNEAAFRTAVAAVRPTGRVVVTAVHAQPVELDLRDLLRRSLTVVAAIAYPVSSWPARLAQIDAGSLALDGLVTGRFPLVEAPAAFERLLAPDSDDLKLLVDLR
jgi:(R,R)-butanediol dehydrogenase/meso-butanediol dehydrogenase/diacetyl reductase